MLESTINKMKSNAGYNLKEYLVHEYWDKKKPLYIIALQLEVSCSTLLRTMRSNEIVLRTNKDTTDKMKRVNIKRTYKKKGVKYVD